MNPRLLRPLPAASRQAPTPDPLPQDYPVNLDGVWDWAERNLGPRCLRAAAPTTSDSEES